MPDRNTQNPNRTMDYNRSQYGGDRFKTPNTSSNYEKEVEDPHRTQQFDAEPNSVESSETFLDEYREHHGQKVSDPQGDALVGPNKDYDFYKTNLGEVHYKAKENEGLFDKIKRSLRNLRRSH